MIDYPALDAVAAVVREGSFERAAALLNVTPSAISQRVRGLEERIGSVLIVRGQPCRPTAVGARLCAHVEQVRLMEADMAGVLPGLATPRTATPTIRVAVNADSLSTWFAPAAATFAVETGALLDLVLEDETRTAERLRDGDVLAAVTSDPVPVQGCRTVPIGSMRYVATASPDYMRRHFADGVTAAALRRAPTLRFDRRDLLQAEWARVAFGIDLDAPTHWVPASHGFLDMAMLGLGWAMNPSILAGPHIDKGILVDLSPGTPLDVALYWQVSRIGAGLLAKLTDTIIAAARRSLRGL